jgi:prepilin-type N-terminal cleavage/methylation domain-containing protein
MSGHRHRHGFTLIEMAVAVVIFMLFISSVYGTYNAAHRAYTSAEEMEEVYQTGRVLLAQLGTELASAYQAPGEDASTLIGEDTDSASDELQADILTFLTTAHTGYGDEPAGDLCRVTYVMGVDSMGETPGLYVEENFQPGLEMDEEEIPARRLLSPLVAGFNCRYLPVDSDWVTEWIDETTLPIAVRVELTLLPPREGAKPIVLVTTANLAMATAPAGGGADALP